MGGGWAWVGVGLGSLLLGSLLATMHAAIVQPTHTKGSQADGNYPPGHEEELHLFDKPAGRGHHHRDGRATLSE